MRGIVHIWLIILLLLSSFGFTINRLQDPDFLVSQAREVSLYNRVVNKYDTFLPKDLINNGQLSADEMKQVLTYAIDGETFYSILHDYLAAYLDYYTGRSSKLYFGYDLTKINTRAKTKTTEILSARYYNSLPECKSDQLRDWSMENSLPSCRLAKTNVAQTDIDRQLSTLSEKLFKDMPTSIVVDSASNSAKRTRTIVSIDVKVNYALWIITGVLTLLYLLIRRRKAFLPLGIISLLVGGLEVGISFFAWDYLAKNIVDYAANKQDWAAYSTMIADVTDLTAQVLKTSLGTIAIFTLGTGMACIILAIFNRAKKIVPAV